METLLIIALLASNVWLIRKVLTKPDVQSVGKMKWRRAGTTARR